MGTDDGDSCAEVGGDIVAAHCVPLVLFLDYGQVCESDYLIHYLVFLCSTVELCACYREHTCSYRVAVVPIDVSNQTQEKKLTQMPPLF